MGGELSHQQHQRRKQQAAKSEDSVSDSSHKDPAAGTTTGTSDANPVTGQEIVIVSKGESEEERIKFTFPPAFKPLIPIGQESLPIAAPAIDQRLLVQLSSLIQSSFKQKADFVLGQQLVLSDIGKDIESYACYISQQTLSQRSKRFARIAENFSKLTQVDTLIQKIDSELETCFKRIQELNESLPEDQRLEPFSLSDRKTEEPDSQ